MPAPSVPLILYCLVPGRGSSSCTIRAGHGSAVVRRPAVIYRDKTTCALAIYRSTRGMMLSRRGFLVQWPWLVSRKYNVGQAGRRRLVNSWLRFALLSLRRQQSENSVGRRTEQFRRPPGPCASAASPLRMAAQQPASRGRLFDSICLAVGCSPLLRECEPFSPRAYALP